MKARGVVRITAADVGRRVSVRAEVQAPPGEPSATEIVGTLLAWENGLLDIRRRDGSVAQVRETDLVAGRTVPDPPPRRPRE